MNLPADDFILLSLINTKLRDAYADVEDLCEAEEISLPALTERLAALGYAYDEASNAFKRT